MIHGIQIHVDADGVAVKAATPLVAVSSALIGGGHAVVDAILNVHVPKGWDGADAGDVVAAFARRRGIDGPYVGLFTAAATERPSRQSRATGP